MGKSYETSDLYHLLRTQMLSVRNHSGSDGKMIFQKNIDLLFVSLLRYVFLIFMMIIKTPF